MPSTDPAVAPIPWLELDVEVTPADEEPAATALWAAGGRGSWTVRPGLVRGYFAGDAPARVVDGFRRAWREATGVPWRGRLAPRPVPSEDWLARWREGARPVRVTPTLWIAPPGTEPLVPSGALAVPIQPGQGFGTGSHPTTRALLTWIEAEPGERVLDVGCGSGVLGIAALRLGARFAVGLDPDPDALANAVENRRRNEPPARGLRLLRGTLAALRPGVGFDRVLANLDRRTLDESIAAIVALAVPGARIGIAGLLDREAAGFRRGLEPLPVAIVAERSDVDDAAGDAWWSAWLARRER